MSAEAAAAPASTLNRTIGLYGAVSLALGIVLGAGMLSLPGLVYAESQGWAVFAWVLDGALVLPLLFVFAVLGRRYPSAGGVAGFVGQAFPGLQIGCSYLLAGTFALGLPAIAVTGTSYFVGALGLAEAPVGRLAVTASAATIIVLVLAMAWIGARFAGTVQNLIVSVLVGSFVYAAAVSAPYWPSIDFTAGTPSWRGVWSGMGLAFFAYTGWEMLAFTAEEFKNPRRDFPIAVAISFVLILGLYIGVALSVQAVVPLDHPMLTTAPFLAVVRATTDLAAASTILTLLVLAIIVTNLNGASWAASRLLFDIGRKGWAPRRLALHSLRGAAAVPRPAILALGLILGSVLAGYGAGLLDLADLLRIAGQNFFLLYTFSILAYVRLAQSAGARVFGVVALAVCVIFAGTFGWGLLYAAAVFTLPYLVRRGLDWRNGERRTG